MDKAGGTAAGLNTIDEIIQELAQGRMVVLMDDEDRENEGDLVMAAECVRPEDVNFMARYGRGLICLTLTRERCEQLRLPLMVNETNDKHLTNFTVSIEAAAGVTTGISAADRATTIRRAVARGARPDDLVQPGHIFPLMAQPGGVLARAGHTEAGCDLAGLAGFEPAGVIVEVLNEDGSMARRDDLERFAAQHGLKIGTVADLIRYRLAREQTVERVAECDWPTQQATFRLHTYRDRVNNRLHFALVFGRISADVPVLIRVHMQDTLRDLLQAERDNLGLSLSTAMQRIVAAGAGVIVVLREPEAEQTLLRRVREFQLREDGVDTPRPPNSAVLRTYGLGAQILRDLGVARMRVLGTPRRMHGLSGFGLDVVEYVTYG
jgi:3,4-dihydroxy 2-butanone 4-phosphate synthase/GTP cyclohydrolase II